MFKEKGYDEILANVYDFTGFVSNSQKLLAEFNKTFEFQRSILDVSILVHK